MPRKIRLILLGLLLFGALLALVTTLVLNSETARGELARQLGQRLDSKINLAGLELAWLPLPHLLIKGGEFEHPKARIWLGELQLYPRWRSLWQGQIKIGRVIMEAPQLFIDPADLNISSSLPSPPLSPAFFPDLGEFLIRRGEITIAAQSGLAGLETPALKLSGIEGRAELASTRLSLELAAHPSFGNTLEVEGWYESGGTHQLSVAGRGLRLHELIISLAHGRVNTLETLANLNLELAGSGPEEFTATLKGDLPCLLLAPAEGRLRLDCGVAHLELSRQRDQWRLRLREFELKEPGMRLNGQITRRLLPGKNAPENEDPENAALDQGVPNGNTPAGSAPRDHAMVPHWEIDLTGSDFAVGQIREAVKASLGRFKAARIFYNTVLNGQAERAAFRFSGPESELKNFKAMTVEVEVASAEIMVPEIDLHLDDASGFLRIRDGILEISRGEAVIGNSRGFNGSLAVGLFRDIPLIQLNLDIDAGLADLLVVLPGLIKHPLFQAETALLRHPEGRATGQLAIGGSKDEFTVLATVETLKGRVESGRLPWPIEVESARARISRKEVRINELRGRVGPHSIKRATGWIGLEENPPFGVAGLTGELAAGPLFGYLQGYPRLAEALAPVLSLVTGRVELRNATATGRLRQPDQWNYELTATPRGLAWYSPLLVAEAVSDGGELHLTPDRLQLQEIDGTLDGDRLILNGNLQHRRFSDWQGELQLAGLLTEAGQQWLEQRNWLPPYLLPAYPLFFDQLVLRWANGDSLPANSERPPPRLTAIAGILQSGSAAEGAALRFKALLPVPPPLGDAGGVRGRGLALNATLTDQQNQAEIDLQLGPSPLRAGELPAISLDFSGALSALSLGLFFREPPFREGLVRGTGEFRLPEGAKAPLFRGLISGNGLLQPEADPALPPLPPLSFSLELTGGDGEMILRHLELDFSDREQLRLSGRLIPDPTEGTLLDLELDSPFLRRSTMSAWQNRLRRDPLLVPEEGRMRWPLLGSIAFRLTELVTGPAAPRYERASLTWQPLEGRLDLHPGGGMSAAITRGVLCCLETSGTWFSEPRLGVSNFKVSSSCPESSRFEQILPCFGIEQDMISGDCLVDAELHGELDFWRQGEIRISSPGGGRIMRLKLLSRIFSLVNLTDIFSGGIAGLDERGFAYRHLDFEGRIEENILRLEEAVVRGEGLNLFAAGTLDLTSYQADMVVLIAPFKTLDAIVGKIPFIGRALGGPNATLITIPVGIKGDIREPEIMVLPPEAVGEGMINLVRNTLLLPFNILSPILPERPSEP